MNLDKVTIKASKVKQYTDAMTNGNIAMYNKLSEIHVNKESFLRARRLLNEVVNNYSVDTEAQLITSVAASLGYNIVIHDVKYIEEALLSNRHFTIRM